MEYSDENKIKITPEEEDISDEDRKALKADRENPLAEEESYKEDDFGHAE